MKSDKMSETPKIACVAIIGPDCNPLLVRRYTSEKQEQEIDTLLFCTLDYFDQKSKSPPGFLGNLQTSDRFQIWGYRTNLSYKIVVFSFHNANVKEDEMRTLCEKVKKILSQIFMDPFYQPFSPIKSQRICEQIDALCQ